MFPDSSLVFVPDPQAKYVPGRVVGHVEPGKPGVVALLDDAGRAKVQLELPGTVTAKLVRMDEESLKSIPDMVEFKVLTEAAVLHNLRLRFRSDEVYTSIGDVLIAINPFKLLPLYTPLIVDSYITAPNPTVCAPHVYKLTDYAFRRLVEFKKSQACMVTGESGSGKTETTKVLLQYLAEVSSSWSAGGSSTSTDVHVPTSNIHNAALADKILKSNPLLESFGNASTRKNANSSRFGKLIEVAINSRTSEIVSGKTTIFLLEKSRLPNPAEGERNFHVFYQLCAGARVHPEIREQYEVLDLEEYRYLNGGASLGVEPGTGSRVSDISGWEDLMKAMKVLKLSSDTRDDALRVVSGILHLGNIDIEANEDIHHSQASKITNPATLKTAERLLDMTDLERALTQKQVSAGGEIVSQHQSVEKAKKARDALAIFIYSALFDFIAAKINDTMQDEAIGKSLDCRSLCVLDIFGFESFAGPNNSFEQLCINYCNEKLQHQFNEFVFTRERLEYEREEVSFSKNPGELLEKSQKATQLVLELFEKPKQGLFYLMDEESTVPGGSDAGLLKRMITGMSNNPSFEVGKKDLRDVAFVVRHFVGPVIYKVSGLLEKNDEGSLPKDLQLVCSHSKIEFIRKAPSAPKSHLGTQFSSQLDRLVKRLSEMEPHFIRCIKPNVERKGGVFNAAMVLDQLQCAGIFEVCKIRNLGFPIRNDFVEFRNRYRHLATKSTTKRFLSDPSPKAAVEMLCLDLVDSKLLTKETFACGKTKVFLKSSALIALEERLEKLKDECAVKIQSRVRGVIARERMQRSRNAISRIIKATADGDLAALRESLQNASLKRLLGGAKHIPSVRAGWKRASQLQEVIFSRNLITRAMKAGEPNALRSALQFTMSLVPEDDPVRAQAQQALCTLDQDQEVIEKLEDATSSNGIEELELQGLVSKGNDILGRRGSEPIIARRVQLALEKVNAKLDRIRIESSARKQLEHGLETKSNTDVEEAREKLSAMGVPAQDSLIRRASMFLNDDSLGLLKEDAPNQVPDALQALQTAMNLRDADTIAQTLVRAISEGLGAHPIVDEATKLEKTLRKAREDARIIEDVSSVIEMKVKNQEGSGVSEADVKIAEQVKEQVEDETLKAKAEKIVDLAQEIVEAQNALHAALAIGPSIEFDKLRQTLERAYACGINGGELLYRVQKMMRTKHRERRLAKKKVVIDVQGKVPEKRKKKTAYMLIIPNLDGKQQSLKEQAEMLVGMSRDEGDRYLLSNFYQIRARMEGEAPRIQHKQGKVLEDSILENIPREVAENISKLILSYTGERSVSFPPTSAYQLLELGASSTEVADEVYVQLCAHLTENLNAESATRTWQLLCLAVQAFFPSHDLLLFLVRFLIDRAEGRTDAALPADKPPRGPLPTTPDTYTLEQRYAWYCLKRLQKELASVEETEQGEQHRQAIPALEEIQAYGERVPVVSSVTLPDGSTLLENELISPMMTVHDITMHCLKLLGINQPELFPTFGLFVRPVDKEAMNQRLAVQSQLSGILSSSSTHDSTPNDTEMEQKRSTRRTSMPSLQKSPSSRARFRLSITAVFGFGRASKAEPGTPELPPSFASQDDDKNSIFNNPQPRQKNVGTVAPKHGTLKKATMISGKRTEDEIDWDVPLVPYEHVGDVLLRYLRAGRGAPRLVFKKRLFVSDLEAKADAERRANKLKFAGTHAAVLRIEALQANDDFATGALPFDKEDEVAEVVAARVALKFGNKLPATDAERLMSIGQVDSFVPAPWRPKKSELNWARAVLEKKGKIVGRDDLAIQLKILDRCKSRPTYGAQMFRVTKVGSSSSKSSGAPSDLVLGVHLKGFFLYSLIQQKVLLGLPSAELSEYKVTKGGTVTLVHATNPENTTVLASPHAREIVALAKEYEIFHARYATQQGDSDEQSGEKQAEDASEGASSDTENLRDHLVRVGATDHDIADVLRV